jgi:hypothetical protein
VHLIIKRSRQATRMMNNSLKAKNHREHLAWHRTQAEIFRKQAEAGEDYLAHHADDHTEEEIDRVKAEIERFKVLALETDNADCLETHH